MYTTKELALVIPTKDRPKQVKRHLQSLVDQNCKLGRVIVVASGVDIEEIVLSFKDRLPVEYYRSEPGQIKQRNLGISKLDYKTKLVASMDDDVTYEEDAIKNIIAFWNETSGNIGGVGFNIINMDEFKSSIFVRLLEGPKANAPGSVLKSGVNTSITNVNVDIHSEWLNGGGTVWKKEILLKYKHQEIKSKWALYEDAIFSYPISKEWDFFICSKSKIKIEYIPVMDNQSKQSYFIGISYVLWRLLFVVNNKDLSLFHYYKRVLFQIFSNLFKCVFLLNKYHLMHAIGILVGLSKVLFIPKSKNEVLKLIENI